MTNLLQRVRGLVACLALLILVMGFPLILITIGFAPWDADLSELRSMLTRPDDGTLALAAFAGVGWAAWTVLAGSVLLAAVAEIRRVPAPSIPGLALPQHAAARLVGIAALLFVAAPTLVAALPPAHSAAMAPRNPAVVAEAEPVAPPTATNAAYERHTLDRSAATRDYTVSRGDSLWRIAERLFGDGARYSEIVALNSEALNGRPDFITPGTVLQVPDERPANPGAPTDDTYVVAPGDTLSEIAEVELGDADRYPEIHRASSGTVQPDGAHLADPDLIRPGWKLTIPGRDNPGDENRNDPDPVRPTPKDDATPTAPVPPTEAPSASNDATPQPTPPTNSAEGADADSAGSPLWLVTGLAGSGVLVGGILLAVRAHRRTQLRYRRPGQTLAPPPPDLVNVDKTAQVHGASAAVDIEGLDRALRHLAAQAQDAGAAAPALTSICLAAGLATVRLRQPASLRDPWQGEGCEWQIKLGAVQDDLDVLPPYPLLVSVGEDETGSLWLVNLEDLGSIAIAGDDEAGLALARHLAAELALNPWSLLVQTDTFGLGDELADLDTHRLRVHAEDDPEVRSLVAELQAEAQSGCDEPDPFHVLITRSPEGAAAVVEAIDGANCRLGAVVVTFGTGTAEGSTVFEIDGNGRMTIAPLDLPVVAAGLSADEAAMCAAIVDVTRITPTIDIPTFEQAADGWRSLTDQAGALRQELTEPRPAVGGTRSLLPESTDEYVAAAATTAADVEELAPVVSEGTRRAVEDIDPALDEDLAAWLESTSSLPRLTLLGPVRASAHGDVVAVAKRRPYFVELLSFLALHPEGVNAQAIADAFNISKSRARTDVGFVRDWLGVNPRTGQLHLPRRGRPNEPQEQSAPGYHVEDLLVDADLFRRLRARGQARGAEGVHDLANALHLVNGLPFDQLREHGWNWLFEGDRVHETIPCAIVDTAHIVAVEALHRGDLDLAREAAETACLASPYDDVARLDLAKVLEAQGHGDSADRTLNEDVFNRRDDDAAPIDLPTRTHEIVARKGWGQPLQTKASGPSPRPHAS